MRQHHPNEKKGVGDDDMPGEGNRQGDDTKHRTERTGVMVITKGYANTGAHAFNAERADENDEAPPPGHAVGPLPGGVEMSVGEREHDQDRVAISAAEIDELREFG